MNQLVNADLNARAPQTGDFRVGELVIESGGRSKNATQVKSGQAYLIASDDIETGIGTKVSLWIFGFLY